MRDLLDPRLRGSGGAGLGSGGMSARAIEGARRTLQKAARSTRSATRQSQPTGQKRANQQFSVSESGIDAGQVISERANEGVSCKSLQYKELQN